jgi:hypothetical protein
VEQVLPLTISPAPAEMTRVFVGRVEVLSPWMEKNIESALATGDVPVLAKYGRFLNPFMNQMTRKHGIPVQSPTAKSFLQSAYNAIQREFDSPGCSQ